MKKLISIFLFFFCSAFPGDQKQIDAVQRYKLTHQDGVPAGWQASYTINNANDLQKKATIQITIMRYDGTDRFTAIENYDGKRPALMVQKIINDWTQKVFR